MERKHIPSRAALAAKAECTARAAADAGAVYVDAGPIGARDENKAKGPFRHAGVANHPGDLGMRRLAELVLDGFREAELRRRRAPLQD